MEQGFGLNYPAPAETRKPTGDEKALPPPVHLLAAVDLDGGVGDGHLGPPALPLEQGDQRLLGLTKDDVLVGGRHVRQRQAGLEIINILYSVCIMYIHIVACCRY